MGSQTDTVTEPSPMEEREKTSDSISKSIFEDNANVISMCENLSYEPITSFDELMQYGTESISSQKILDLCKSKTVPLVPSRFGRKFGFTGKSVDKDGKFPLTLVCHDLKGGYGDDRFIHGTSNMENYTYRHWLLTDIFVYFSHKFVTIPPLGWINAAHSHGVKILGTIITEWDDGVALCNKILSSEESINDAVKKLCKINEDYGFDGYLLNVENKLEQDGMVERMAMFTKRLTEELKKLSPNNMVIWYDSVIKDGNLKWQDELNDKNKLFFDVCDGIYLNYNWNDEKLRNTVVLAGDRRYDVFVGVDCWGRGCWGGGGVNTCLAIDKIFPHNLSYAIFAPGWTYENHTFAEYPWIDDELWTKCMKNMYVRCLVASQPTNQELISEECNISAKPESCDNTSDKDTKKFQVFFATDFSRGYGTKMFSFGKVISEKPWFDLSKQSFQPVIFSSVKCLEYDCTPAQKKLMCKVETEKKQDDKPSSTLIGTNPKIVYDTESGFSGGGALKLLNSKKQKDFEDPLTSSPVWFPLHIPVTASRLTLATVAVWKSTSIHHQLKLYLELGKDGCPDRKILLGSLDSLATSVRGKFFISLKLSQFLQDGADLPSLSADVDKNDLQFYFQKNNYDEKELSGWRVSCYLFDIDQVYDEYSSIKSLRVGADGDISLGFLSLGQITHYQQ